MKTQKQLIDLDTYVFTFGKHKNRSIRDVIDDDANYVLWCHDNIEWFKLSEGDYDKVDLEADRQGNQGDLSDYDGFGFAWGDN